MIGDFLGGGYALISEASGSRPAKRVPYVGRGAFKVAENESPRPVDRVFATFNEYNNINLLGQGDANLYRGLVGFEKTFLDGNASLGLRVPFQQTDGVNYTGLDGFGDITIVLKYAPYLDQQTGDVFSGGLLVTVPTGTSPVLYNGDRPNSVLLQPWVGFIYNIDRMFVHGFSSFVFPTQGSDPNLFLADVGVAYWLYRGTPDSVISAVIPTLEAHMNVGLDNNNQVSSPIYFPDTCVLIGGVHLGMGRGCLLTLGAGLPVTGPRPYEAEFIAQWNYRF